MARQVENRTYLQPGGILGRFGRWCNSFGHIEFACSK